MVAVTSLVRAEQIILSRLNVELEPLGLTFPRYEALMLLYYSREGALPLGKISDRLQVHRTSVTNVIDKLVDAGYVERGGDVRDRRTVLARITSLGERRARQATKLLNAIRFGVAPLTDATCEEIYSAIEPLRRAAEDFLIPKELGGP
jgi:DNA-binding MarR family transcriptional regulator